MDAARNTIIKHDYTDDEWDGLKYRVSMRSPEELAAIAERLGGEQCSTWQDYADQFSEYTWSDFIEAYEHCTGRKYFAPGESA